MRSTLGSVRFATSMTNESCVFGHDEQREDLQLPLLTSDPTPLPLGLTASCRSLPTPTSRTSSGPTTRRGFMGCRVEMLKANQSSWSSSGRSGSSPRGDEQARSRHAALRHRDCVGLVRPRQPLRGVMRAGPAGPRARRPDQSGLVNLLERDDFGSITQKRSGPSRSWISVR